MISPADMAMLRKLLSLTASEHDGEALVAIRKANELLQRLKLHWHDIVALIERHQVVLVREVRVSRPVTIEEQINNAFSDVLATTHPGKFRDFIMDLEAQWDDKGSLSPKQRAALLRAASRAREAR